MCCIDVFQSQVQSSLARFGLLEANQTMVDRVTTCLQGRKLYQMLYVVVFPGSLFLGRDSVDDPSLPETADQNGD